MPMNQNIFSVSDLIKIIKQTLELSDDLTFFYVKGEISNFTSHRNGHWYFSLKDEKAKINCVMFQSYANGVDFKPKEGDQVLIRASISVYALQGSIQCSVFNMQNIGLGNLYIQYEKLKKKLYDLGYFDLSRKKTLPKFPQRIAIITGSKSAALQDMFKMAHLRWPMVEIVLFETLVQGTQAPSQIINSLLKADQAHCDVIILARGGGSFEDLWAFNDEKIAECILSLKTPIVTGVGHESDTTIVDYVADFRAATPTQAIQHILADRNETIDSLQLLRKQLIDRIGYQLHAKRNELLMVQQQRFIKDPKQTLQQHRVQIDLLKHRMINASKELSLIKNQLDYYTYQMKHSLLQNIEFNKNRVHISSLNLNKNISNNLNQSKQQFSQLISLLNAFSPLNSLERGYSLTYKNEVIVQSIHQVRFDDALKIRLKDGMIETKVIKIGETK